MIEVASSLGCLLGGVDMTNPSQKCLGIANGKIGPADSNGGVIGAMGGLIAQTFVPPGNTGSFVRYLSRDFGITKNAYAADAKTGFDQLNPFLPAWIAFRNLTYVLFIIIFIVIGFAIMLRVHIDPRTVMTIENQIPKIIIGLILVTFSYAIIGFMIDLMWVFIFLVFNAFSGIGHGLDLSSFDPSHLQGQNALEIANGLNTQGVVGQGGIFGIATTVTSSVIGIIFNFIGLGGLAGGILNNNILNHFITLISGAIGFFASTQAATAAATSTNIPILSGVFGAVGAAGTALAAMTGAEFLFRNILPNLIVFLIVSMAMVFALVRLWFTLIKAYVMILVVTVFSPFWILAGLLPGSKLSFTSLLREIGSNLISFPATIVMFLLGKTFIDLLNQAQGGFFVPPLIGRPGEPNTIGAIIGFGIILLTPDVVKMMRKALQAPEFDFAAIGAAVGVGIGAITGAPGGTAKMGRALEASKGMTGIRRIGEVIGYMQNPYH